MARLAPATASWARTSLLPRLATVRGPLGGRGAADCVARLAAPRPPTARAAEGPASRQRGRTAAPLANSKPFLGHCSLNAWVATFVAPACLRVRCGRAREPIPDQEGAHRPTAATPQHPRVFSATRRSSSCPTSVAKSKPGLATTPAVSRRYALSEGRSAARCGAHSPAWRNAECGADAPADCTFRSLGYGPAGLIGTAAIAHHSAGRSHDTVTEGAPAFLPPPPPTLSTRSLQSCVWPEAVSVL